MEDVLPRPIFAIREDHRADSVTWLSNLFGNACRRFRRGARGWPGALEPGVWLEYAKPIPALEKIAVETAGNLRK
jgi:hypothetical protein